MRPFFDPEGVAVVGASSHPGKIGYEIVKNVSKVKKVYPINPHAKEILGIPCYPSISAIDGDVELAIYALPSKHILEVIEECAKKGIKSMVVVSGGFKEVGNEDLERKMVEKAKKNGIRIIGPNCIGVFNAKNGFNTFFQTNFELPSSGNLAILTQSGTFGIGLLEELTPFTGVSKFVSYGNKADVDEIDMLEYFKHDDETKFVAMYIEGLENGRKFFEKVKEVKKPVVILKAGRTSLGAKAASLHTGALATNYEILRGACHQYGAILADDFEEFIAIISMLAMQPLPRGGKIGMVTNGAGPCVMAADYIYSSRHLELPSLKLNASSLPSFATPSNPIDLTGSATAEHFIMALRELANSDIDIILSFFVFQDAPLALTMQAFYDAIEEIKKHEKMLIGVAIGGKFTQEQRKKMARHGIPVFKEPSVVIKALEKIVRYSKWRQRNENSGS